MEFINITAAFNRLCCHSEYWATLKSIVYVCIVLPLCLLYFTVMLFSACCKFRDF